MLKEAYRLMDSTPADIHPSSALSDFEPLTQGQYPIFNKYPTFIVEYQSQERERIRQQEVEYLRERCKHLFMCNEWRISYSLHILPNFTQFLLVFVCKDKRFRSCTLKRSDSRLSLRPGTNSRSCYCKEKSNVEGSYRRRKVNLLNREPGGSPSICQNSC